MSTACPGCNKAIMVEDVVVKSYTPVFDLRTCGKIRITKRGRVAAKRIQSGDGIVCEGVMEGNVETDGKVKMGPKASWKGESLQSRSLAIADGAKLLGVVTVPWHRPEPKKPTRPPTATPKTRPMIVSTPTTKPKLARTPQSTTRTITKSSTIKEPKLARTPPAKAPATKKRSTKKKPARAAVAAKPATASRKPSKTKKPARSTAARKKVARISQSRAKKTSRKVAAKASRRK
ncbi:MAG: polymer-forming cytoskeletal protein [Planctomycetes bacterium]|nr:polymer-forming cytoskeletal protein [Planctomycetota bacterium]